MERMEKAEIAETLRGCYKLMTGIADEENDSRLWAIATAVAACADAVEEEWNRE